MTVLLVALGAAVGAPLRYLTDLMLRNRFGAAFPWGTLTVNVTGSFVLGLVLGLPLPAGAVALLGTGFCGALTTYSTFSWEILALTRRSEIAAAAGYALLSITAGMGAAVFGGALAQAVS
ncbi:putative fluoride ion transporter CrcB 2 [Actinoplanes lobatus]|uniref:Fluoride-specific ion channel FluC n=1 Tax=Actinoplanes lobatus TaxID=113568 RepID=A0A7W7MFJ0_9ACTN|nr:fluoride efflux transporter CrcB [Actinoplanes lobatus]MBB4748306.1 CrcB protein [Actinoplanes lobatus]GGN70691.1 putative fluoride ion transporter CrcB 2 [Actinoplanes lobatus]GIE40156.1 putative fluoride ion transporter CrcB 2 [Actinoplanes lobatus]